MFMLVVSMVTGDHVHTHYDSQYKSYVECRQSITKDKQMVVALAQREHIKDGTMMMFVCMPSSNYINQRDIAIRYGESTSPHGESTEHKVLNSNRNKRAYATLEGGGD